MYRRANGYPRAVGITQATTIRFGRSSIVSHYNSATFRCPRLVSRPVRKPGNG